MWTSRIVSTWSDDGHLHATRYNEATVSIAGREAADCRRGIGRGSIGGAGGTGARSQRQSGLQLVQAVSGWAKWLAGLLGGHDSHPTAACASAGRKWRQSSVVACVVGVSAAMIAPPGNTQIWIAAGVTDLRRGFTGLSALVQTKLEKSPFSGHVFVFRGRRGDLIKLLWFDGDGLCLFSKRLERGRF